MRGVAAVAALLALSLPALAQQQQPPTAEDLRPDGLKVDDILIEDLPLGTVPQPGEPTIGIVGSGVPAAVTTEGFGPGRRDEAYGAFQRGLFLTALDLALPRAQKDDAAAQTLIAEIYSRGLGVAENPERAAGWYELASKNGDRLATFELALLFQEGRGVPLDRARAAKLFQESADQGYPPAQYNLGLLHIEGLYVTPSVTRAAELIKAAATAGVPEAQYDYGNMLLEGAGLTPDAAEAARQLQSAAESGLVSAAVDYATLLYLGRGVPKDREAAAAWYRRAADGGSPVAQNRYAKLLAVGEGVPLDLEEAAMWRALARRQGLSDPTLDDLLISIAQDDLARAEERARFWPSPPPTATADAGTAIPQTAVLIPPGTEDPAPAPDGAAQVPEPAGYSRLHPRTPDAPERSWPAQPSSMSWSPPPRRPAVR